MNRLQHWIDKIEEADRALNAIEERLESASMYRSADDVQSVRGLLRTIRKSMEFESRTAYVVQEIDKQNEAAGEAIKALLAIQHASMTPEERAAQARRDNDYLFGDREVGR